LAIPEGGVIYLGVDKSGNVVGLEDADAVQLKVKDRLKNNIQPSCLGLFDVSTKLVTGRMLLKLLLPVVPKSPITSKSTGCLKRVAFFASAAQANPCRYV